MSSPSSSAVLALPSFGCSVSTVSLCNVDSVLSSVPCSTDFTSCFVCSFPSACTSSASDLSSVGGVEDALYRRWLPELEATDDEEDEDVKALLRVLARAAKVIFMSQSPVLKKRQETGKERLRVVEHGVSERPAQVGSGWDYW